MNNETIIRLYEQKIRFSALSFVRNQKKAEEITDIVCTQLRTAKISEENIEDLDLYIASIVREISMERMMEEIIGYKPENTRLS